MKDLLRHWLGHLYLLLKFGLKTRFTLEIDGVPVVYSTADAYSRHWFYPRYAGGKIHEERVTRLLVKQMADSECFVDVGAHIGFYTCLAARLMPGHPVHAFEMNALFYKLLVRNIELNEGGQVHSYHAAVTDISGEVGYPKRPKRFYNARLRLAAGCGKNAEAPQVRVRAVSLDDAFENREPKPDLIKIDVEGAEMMVLRGMRNLLRLEKLRLFVEVHPIELRALGSSVEAVISALQDQDFAVHEIKDMREEGREAKLQLLDATAELTTNTMLFAHKRTLR